MKIFFIVLPLFIFVLFLSCSEKKTELNTWKFKKGDNLSWAKPGYDDSGWKSIQVGKGWELQGYKKYDGYGWYRFRFKLSSKLKENALFKDSLLFLLGKIDDRDKTFLNGMLLGQNAQLVPANHTIPVQDLSQLPTAWNIPRKYTISTNDPRLFWDQENVLAIRVHDGGNEGGLLSLPVDIRLKNLSDYLFFDPDARIMETKPNGIISKTIYLKNTSPFPELKGTLTLEFSEINNQEIISKQSHSVVLQKEKKEAYTFDIKEELLPSTKATYTFTESSTGNKVVYTREPECSGGWIKYENNPILGGHLGMIFDVCVLKNEEGTYQMYCSLRHQGSIGISESKDGLNWTVPVICFTFKKGSSWEQRVNRMSVIKKDGIYHMWYTGQIDLESKIHGRSCIGYAVSNDGKKWIRKSNKPVLSPEFSWEDVAVMCPHVLWDEQEKIYKMWYSGGEFWEPDAIGYATSKDGLNWKKHENPIFRSNKQNEWEKNKVTACQIIKRSNDYLMFYIGFKDLDHAQIGMARSKDGISNWERYKENPIIRPGLGWDALAIYKPYVVPDPENNRWLLYYNARRTWREQIGAAIHKGMDLGF